MAIEFRVPDLGENIDSADVGQILVKEGETISAGKNVLELETEKAVFEVECPHAGTITKIHVKPGDSVSVGTLILSIEPAAAGATPTPLHPRHLRPLHRSPRPRPPHQRSHIPRHRQVTVSAFLPPLPGEAGGSRGCHGDVGSAGGDSARREASSPGSPGHSSAGERTWCRSL